MKFLITICSLIILLAVSAGAQQSDRGSLTMTQTKEAERRLAEIGYWTGLVDGIFDPETKSALIAFQKLQGRSVTGRLTVDELDAIRRSDAPKAREPGYVHVEVDLDRQVLLFVNHDGRVRVLPVSTGNDQPFLVEGQTSIAYTPRGRFLVYEKEAGWGNGPLGAMYYSNFISGGVAIHGSPNVPKQPASHGCIRVPMFAARGLSKLMPVGTIVLVYDKMSFVSAKEWVENPKLRQAALLSSTANAYEYTTETTKPKSGYLANKKARMKIIRA